MSILDILIAMMVLVGLWRGFHAGAIKTVMSLVAWFVAFIMASALAKTFSPLFIPVVDNEILQISLAFLAIVLIIVSITHLISWLALKTFKFLKLGFFGQSFRWHFRSWQRGVKSADHPKYHISVTG